MANDPDYDGSIPLGNSQRELYAIGLRNGLRKKDAHKNSGYSTVSWAQHCNQIEKDPDFRKRIKYLMEETNKKLGLTESVSRAQCFVNSQTILRMALKGVPSIDRNGKVIQYEGEGGKMVNLTKPDLSAANRAVEIQAKLSGYLIDVQRDEKEDKTKGMDKDQLLAVIAATQAQIDPNLDRRQQAKAEKIAPATEPPVVDVEDSRGLLQ